MIRPRRIPILITFIRTLFTNNFNSNLYIMEKKKRQLTLDFTPISDKKGKTESESTNWAKLEPLASKIDYDGDFDYIKSIAQKSNLYIGAHISASGGVEKSPENAYLIAGQSFAMFLKNQRRWDCPDLTQTNITAYSSICNKYGYRQEYVLPHGSFLINMANPKKRNRAFGNFMDDLKRCEQLGIKLYNFHPGSTCGLCESSIGISNIANCINEAISKTKFVKIVLENSAGQKNVIGSKFEDLANIISQVNNKDRIGVCLDTCHLFAAGYDIRTEKGFDEVMKKFDKIVGLKYLSGVHLNDCKSDLSSGLDRHENLGKGKLTRETFQFVANSPYFRNMPIILETPDIRGDETIYKQEIKLMYSLVKL